MTSKTDEAVTLMTCCFYQNKQVQKNYTKIKLL